EYLNRKLQDIQDCLNKSEPVPIMPDVLEDFTNFQDQIRRRVSARVSEPRATVGTAVPDATPNRPDEEACTRLYRRAAQLLHPDKAVTASSGAQRTAWFVTLREHRWDHFYLQALVSAFDPFGPRHADIDVEEVVSRLFDRLFLLKDIKERLA